MSNIVNFPHGGKNRSRVFEQYNSIMKPWLEANAAEFLQRFTFMLSKKTAFFQSNEHWTKFTSSVGISGYNPAKAIVFKRGVDIFLDDELLEKLKKLTQNDIYLTNF